MVARGKEARGMRLPEDGADIVHIIEAQIHDKIKSGLGYKSIGENIEAQVNDKVNSEIGYKSVPPPFVQNVYPSLEPKRNSEVKKVESKIPSDLASEDDCVNGKSEKVKNVWVILTIRVA
ncbi:hypothetical protein L1987_56966 [Smallanthus sonchifolius]|uniref:Uncharacterized protein n=1 Tax=Smallanthus sonchifolius TaxID=185202 RepID=A0ACB9DBY9_9ASTR|nr:hypothetical protein L1987_56966 [Smallanthus sonchifolius]